MVTTWSTQLMQAKQLRPPFWFRRGHWNRFWTTVMGYLFCLHSRRTKPSLSMQAWGPKAGGAPCEAQTCVCSKPKAQRRPRPILRLLTAWPGLCDFPHPQRAAHLRALKQGGDGAWQVWAQSISTAVWASGRMAQRPGGRLLQSPNTRQQGPHLGWWLENQKGLAKGVGIQGEGCEADSHSLETRRPDSQFQIHH